MPLSSTANFSCDVNKQGGNDLSAVGPFQTIQQAISYLTTNFSPSSSQHAVIYLGPGIYNAAGDLININVNNGTRYIDFVGIGKQDTILQVSSTTAAVRISATGAENRFSNLTIQNTSSTIGNYAVDVTAATHVIFDNCRIQGGAACINNLAQNANMFNCEIISTSTNASEIVIGGMSGLISDSTITATTLGSAGTLINTLNPTGVVQYCILNTVSALGTPVDARGISSLQGKLSHSTCTTQGYSLLHVESGGVVEFCYVSTLGTGSASCSDYWANCVVRFSFFQQLDSTNNLSVIHRGAAVSGTTVVMNCTFYAPSSSGNIVGSLEVDGSIWISCSFYNNGTGGFALAANAAGRAISLGDITANELIDPQISATYDFERGRHNITSVMTAAYTARVNDTVRCNPTGGAFTVTLPAITAGNAGMQLTVKNQSASANVITIATTGTNTVDGAASTTIAASRGKVTVESDGVGDWLIVG